MLAQTYIRGDAHAYCDSAALKAGRREAAVLKELLALGPDIICLQEVEQGAFSRTLEPGLAVRTRPSARGVPLAHAAAVWWL